MAAAAEPPSLPEVPTPHPGTTIVLEVKVRGPMGFPTYDADTVFFVRRCAADAGCDGTLIPSRFARKGRAYLVDVAPGQYVAVAAMFQVLGAADQYLVYFPQSIIDATDSEAAAGGGIIAAGSYVLGMSPSLCPDTAEPQQLAYAEMVEPDTKKCGFAKIVMDKVARSGPIIVGGIAIPTNALLYHNRGTAKESHREPAALERLKQMAAADLAEHAARQTADSQH